jgi:asparagine synthase (glutamine-hydrolysing)
MCGFIGKLTHISTKESKIEMEVTRGLKAIRHRGPDSFKVCTHLDNFALGAVRLAMVDPSPRSNQPMTSVGNYGILAFNGEIYNFKEISQCFKTSEECLLSHILIKTLKP